MPLVRRAWEGSFGIKERAVKAMKQRGWGPFNYALLDHPALKEVMKVPPSTIDAAHLQPECTMLVPQVQPIAPELLNLTSGKGLDCVDTLILEYSKCTGRKAAAAKRKEEKKDNYNFAERLKDLLKFSSSSLYSINENELTPEVLEALEKKIDKGDREKLQAELNKRDKAQKAAAKLNDAINKARQGEKLRSEELEILI